MAEIINTTTDTTVGGWQILGVVMGMAVAKYDDQTINYSSAKEQRHVQRTRVARESALERMNQRATQMGADAVVGIRFDSVVSVTNHYYNNGQCIEYTAYGTAIKF